MNIAHVLSSFGLGGQERVAVDLARAQCAAGHAVLAVSLSRGQDGTIQDCFHSAGARTLLQGKRSGVDVSLPARLACHLRRQRIDVVHTHNPMALVYGALAGRLAGAAVVHTKHGINPGRPRRLWLCRAAANLVDAYIAVTPALADVVRMRHDCDVRCLSVVANGIDVAAFAPSVGTRSAARAMLSIPEKAWVVGTVGRLAPEKDQALLLRATCPARPGKAAGNGVGNGPEREALAALARSSGRAAVHSHPGVTDDVSTLLHAFDVFALPSRTEGLPLVLLEAMATEIVVVATAVGGIPDLVDHGVTGFLVNAGDCNALTAQLSALCADAAGAAQVGQARQRRVLERHSLERMASAYDAVLISVVARHRSDRSVWTPGVCV